MKRTIALLRTALTLVLLSSALSTRVLAAQWRDDFSYESLDELKNAGWKLGNEQMILVGGGLINLTANEQNGSTMSYEASGYGFPSGINDFTVEIRHLLIGSKASRNCNFSILTERHEYGFDYEEDPTPTYTFQVDGQPASASPQNTTDDWHTLILEKNGNLISWYLDGTLKGTHTESDNTRDGLVGLRLSSSSSYDYVSISETSSSTPVQPLYIITGAILAVGILTAIFLFALPHYRQGKSH